MRQMHQSDPRGELFDEAYYMDGISSGKSNYVNYTWKPALTLPFARALKKHWNAATGPAADTVLDYGCARGYTVKALREIGLLAYGFDISEWAIKNADEMAKPFVTHGPIHYTQFDYVLSKDVMEHVPLENLADTIDRLVGLARKRLLVIVPLCKVAGGDYVRQEDNQDATHVIRWTLEDWLWAFFSAAADADASVTGSYHVPGLKPTSMNPMKSCGFIEVVKG